MSDLKIIKKHKYSLFISILSSNIDQIRQSYEYLQIIL